MAALPPGANSAEMILFMNNMASEVVALRAEIVVLKSMNVNAADKDKEKSLKDLKSFSAVPQWNGNEKYFGDFEFKLHTSLAQL